MKKFALILILGLGLRQIDLPAQVSFGTYNPPPSVKGIDRDVYIAYRTDGATGKGTADDPFDGSTAAKFDAALSNAVASSAFVHIGPGTFLSSGFGTNIFEPSGVYKIQGAGIGVTKVKLADNTMVTTNEHTRFLFYHWSDEGQLGYFELSDLTIDCNSVNQPIVSTYTNANCGAVTAYTQWGSIHDVLATGMGSGGRETFPIHLWGYGLPKNCHYSMRRIRAEPSTGYMTVIMASSAGGGGVSGVIEDCTVIANGTQDSAFGGGDMHGFRFCNNIALGSWEGMHFDTGVFSDVSFVGNRIWGINHGIRFFPAASTFTNITACYNTFSGGDAFELGTGSFRQWGNTRVDAGILNSDDIRMTEAAGFDTNSFLFTGGKMTLLGGSGQSNTVANLGGVATNISLFGSATNAGMLVLSNSAAALDEKIWTRQFSPDGLYYTTRNDADVVDEIYMTISRTGRKVNNIGFIPGVIFYNGVTNKSATNALIYADSNCKESPVTIGPGLDFSGGILSSTGAVTNTAAWYPGTNLTWNSFRTTGSYQLLSWPGTSNCVIELPSAGTYLIGANLEAVNLAGWQIMGKFSNSTAGADIEYSERQVWPASASHSAQIVLNNMVTVGGASTIKIWVKDDSGGGGPNEAIIPYRSSSYFIKLH